MVNLRRVYKHAEQHTAIAAGVLFGLLVVLLILQSVFSPALVFSGIIVMGLFAMTVLRAHWTLGLLALYLPFETIVLKFTPDNVYVFARYLPEFLIYLVALTVLWRFLSGSRRWQQTRFDLPMALFVLALGASALVNLVDPTVAILGLRQILRFILVFFLVVQLSPSKKFVLNLTWLMLLIVLFQSALGIVQSVAGETLDAFLLPSQARTLGSITLTEGVQQFWDPGSRVFATLGRYDRLGNFLYIFLALAVGMLFTPSFFKKHQWILAVFALGLPAIVLTYSRSSWFAFLLGFLFIGLIIKKDRRVLAGLGIFVTLAVALVGVSGLNVSLITEAPGQSLSERFYESFSYARWRGEYYGLGRVFWYVHTPADVVPASPILGFGPGQFGGGAVAALHNTSVYEQLGLPYGVFGTEGFIDNNWFSLWGEGGTLGIGLYLWFYASLFLYAMNVARTHKDPFIRALALGVCAMLIGVAFNAFTSTVFEIRTSAYYLWLYAGLLYVLASRGKEGIV